MTSLKVRSAPISAVSGLFSAVWGSPKRMDELRDGLGLGELWLNQTGVNG